MKHVRKSIPSLTGIAVGYALTVRLPWDAVCTFTHVLPLSAVLFWNVLFFTTWFAMHLMYFVILLIALRHKKQIKMMEQRRQRPSQGLIAALPLDPRNLPTRYNIDHFMLHYRENILSYSRRSLGTPRFSVIWAKIDQSNIRDTFKTIRYRCP